MAGIVIAAAVLVILWAMLSGRAVGETIVTDTNQNPDAGSGQTSFDAGSSPATFEDKVQQFVQAVANAEGFGKPGAAPTTHNNPGDLGPGDTGFPGDFHSGTFISRLPDPVTGFQLLTKKITNVFNGTSHVYSPDMTIQEFANTYVGDPQGKINWAKNVSASLGVTPDTKISDWLNS